MAEKVVVVMDIDHEEESVYSSESKVQLFSKEKPQKLLDLPSSHDDEERKEHSSRTLTFLKHLINDLISFKVWKASLAELIGTAVLVFALDTIVIISSYDETKSNYTPPNLIIISILISLTLSTLLLATTPVSGGHLNPAITLCAVFFRIITLSRALIYIFTQCAGAVLGALALKLVVNSTTEQTYSLGGCTLTVITPGPIGPVVVGIGLAQALWLEIICSFVFLLASVWATLGFDHRQAQAHKKVLVMLLVGLVVGLLVFASAKVIGATRGYAGAGMNPARCLGAALVRGGHLWYRHWVFWVGPTISSLAFYVYTDVFPR